MADPLSIVAGVAGLSHIAIKLITSLSNYVDSVRDAKADVQNLSLQVSSMHYWLSKIRIELATANDDADVPERTDTVAKVMRRCETTLQGLQTMVDKAKTEEVKSERERMIRVLKWTFKDKEVKKYEKLLQYDQDNLVRIMQALSNQNQTKALSILQKLSEKIDQLEQSRDGIKESFAVVEPDDPRATLTIHDRRGQSLRDKRQPPQSRDIFTDQEWRMLKQGRIDRWITGLEFHMLNAPKPLSLTSQVRGEMRILLTRGSHTKLKFELSGGALPQCTKLYEDSCPGPGKQVSTSFMMDAILLGLRENEIPTLEVSFWAPEKHPGNIVTLVPSLQDKQDRGTRQDKIARSLDKIAIRFRHERDVDEFMGMFEMLRWEQHFCWTGVAALFAHQTGLNVNNEQSLLEEGMKREVELRDKI